MVVPALPEGKYVEVTDGLTMHYHEAGVGDRVVLFIHGHSSRLEELEDVIRALRRVRRADGSPAYSAIVCDLPVCGYAARIEHSRIASSDADGVPVLDFLCRFLDLFVSTLMRQHPGFDQVALVAGGSSSGIAAGTGPSRRIQPPRNS